MQKREFDDHPFYAWDCVSLKMETRTVDFVIEDYNDMFSFIQALQNLIYNAREARLKKF